MCKAYAAVADILILGKSLTAQQSEAAEVLLQQASAKLRDTARRYGKDIDSMIADPQTGADFALSVKSVVVQAVCRALDSITDSAAVSQESQSALGYSVSYTYANAGQQLYFLRNELKELGLRRQRIGVLEVYGSGTADPGN